MTSKGLRGGPSRTVFGVGLFVSGLAWLALYLTILGSWEYPHWPTVAAIFIEATLGFLVVLVAPQGSLGRAMLGLWAMAVGLLWAATGFELSLPAVSVAALYGTIAFILWVVPPAVVWSAVRQART